jgi:hypothetical protein
MEEAEELQARPAGQPRLRERKNRGLRLPAQEKNSRVRRVSSPMK